MVQLKGLEGQCTGIKAMQFHIISQSVKSLKELVELIINNGIRIV